MKVLHINPYPPEYLGGSELFCKNLAINLKKRKDIDSDILTSDILRRNIKRDVLYDSINLIYRKNYYNLWGKNPLVNIYSFLRKEIQNYDLVHAHSYIFFTSLQCALFRKLRKFPFILHIHGGVQTPKSLDIGLIENLQLSFKNKFFDRFLGSTTIKNADAIISVSKKELEIIKERFKIQHDNNFYIPNGVDTDIFQNYQHFEKKYITFIGRLTYIKGFDRFIECIRKLYRKNRELEFMIIGKGPLVNLVKAAKKNLPITYYEYCPHDEMINIYNQSKLMLIPSRFEGVPTIILESLACETPVIASNVGGISEVLKNNENGLLLNEFNTKSSISKITDFLNDENKLKTFGKKGRNLMLNNFSWGIITDKVKTVYDYFKK